MPGAGYAQTNISPANSNAIEVRTRDENGANADADFHLIVVCPRRRQYEPRLGPVPTGGAEPAPPTGRLPAMSDEIEHGFKEGDKVWVEDGNGKHHPGIFVADNESLRLVRRRPQRLRRPPRGQAGRGRLDLPHHSARRVTRRFLHEGRAQSAASGPSRWPAPSSREPGTSMSTRARETARPRQPGADAGAHPWPASRRRGPRATREGQARRHSKSTAPAKRGAPGETSP